MRHRIGKTYAEVRKGIIPLKGTAACKPQSPQVCVLATLASRIAKNLSLPTWLRPLSTPPVVSEALASLNSFPLTKIPLVSVKSSP